jgi:hypothetical protein
MPCCCGAPRASPWPTRAARRRWTPSARACGCRVQEAQTGSLSRLPELPTAIDAASTAAYVRDILAGRLPVPAPIGKQLEHILRETGSS